MLQYGFGLAKSTVKPCREGTDQGGIEAIGRPGKTDAIRREFKSRVVKVFLRDEGNCKASGARVRGSQQYLDKGLGEAVPGKGRLSSVCRA